MIVPNGSRPASERPRLRCPVAAVLALALAGPLAAAERTEHFDKDPGWDGYHNRSETPESRRVVQDFGYSRTSHAGGEAGELGGVITPDAEPAYYARRIPAATFGRPLEASGSLACTGRQFHALIGFFNASTLNEWRTPNSIAIRISGRGDVFYAWVEYATSRWRAGGDEPKGFPMRRVPETGRSEPVGFAARGAVHRWSLRYDPEGNGGGGVVTATLDDQTAVCHLADGHKADGATFDRFGLLNLMKSADGGGEVWLDDVRVNGELETFDRDPGWDGLGNRRTYVSTNVRPRFDFGYSTTRHAGGRAEGELGGIVFRGDCRYPDRLAYYGDRLEELTPDRPLRASGKVSLRRGVTDSTVLIGFFHSRESVRVNPAQDEGLPRDFLGISVDGPSREGFYFAPAYRFEGGAKGHASEPGLPHILPDGASHDWTLEYDPKAAGGRGRITVTFDGRPIHLDLRERDKAKGTRFDRFGIVTTWIDGNGQHIYFDDLTYTASQPPAE